MKLVFIIAILFRAVSADALKAESDWLSVTIDNDILLVKIMVIPMVFIFPCTLWVTVGISLHPRFLFGPWPGVCLGMKP